MSFPKCLPTLAPLALVSLLSGCVPYPVYKTMQPDASDLNDKPQITPRPGQSRSCNSWPDHQDPAAPR